MSICKTHKTEMQLAAGEGGYTFETCSQCEAEMLQRMRSGTGSNYRELPFSAEELELEAPVVRPAPQPKTD
jgi:hypothetical protein